MKLTTFILNSILLLCPSLLSAATIGFNPSSASLSMGQTVSLDLVASGLGGAALGDFDIDIAFPAAKLSLLTFAPGSVLGDISLNFALDFTLGEIAPGLLNIAVVSLLPSAELQVLQASPPLVLATLTLTSNLSPGETGQVTIAAVNAFGDGNGDPITLDGLGQADLTGAGVNAVPEPSTLLLMAAGGLALLARRRSFIA